MLISDQHQRTRVKNPFRCRRNIEMFENVEKCIGQVDFESADDAIDSIVSCGSLKSEIVNLPKNLANRLKSIN